MTWRQDIILDSSMLSKKVSEILVSVMWVIWSSRHKYTHEEVRFKQRKSVELVNEFIRSLKIPQEQGLVARPNQSWKPPDQGWIKVNTDHGFTLMEQLIL
jgi:hypothetical protein